MNLNISLLTFFLSILLFSSCASKKEPTRVKASEDESLAVNFIKGPSLMDVVEKAEREGKLVFVDLYTDWCLPCKLMKEDVYTDESIGDFMNDNFINYKVNAEKANGPNMTVLYNIESFPGLLFLDANGRVLEQKQGAAYHTELREMANRALAKSTL